MHEQNWMLIKNFNEKEREETKSNKQQKCPTRIILNNKFQ